MASRKRKDCDNPMGLGPEQLRDVMAAAFECAPIGIALIDLDAGFVCANRRYQEILGYGVAELQQLSDWTSGGARGLHLDSLLECDSPADEEESQEWEESMVSKDGEEREARSRLTLLRDEEGVPRYAIALLEDITGNPPTAT